MGNSTGSLFRITTFGESHGGGVGVTIEGCPAGYKIDLLKVQAFLDRRRPGQSHLSSPRSELDKVTCLSGLNQDSVSLGTPIMLFVRNKDHRPNDYQDLEQVYRPSHADYTTEAKFGIRPASGGGRASARETIGRVAAGAVAEQVLEAAIPGFSVVAYVEAIKGVTAKVEDSLQITRSEVEKTPLRCPSKEDYKALEAQIITAKKKGDSVGGVIYCQVIGCPVGLGEPVFDKLEADLAKSVMSLPACKGFEIGSGFSGTQLYGSQHNDPFYMEEGRVRTKTNNSGGVQGGISNGEVIYFRSAFKPVATIFKKQDSVTAKGEEALFKPHTGRHDPCVLPRAVPIVEASALLVVMDHFLRQSALRARP